MFAFRLLSCAAVLAMGQTLAFAGEKTGLVGDLKELSWMVGAWIERKGGVETEEQWMAPKGELMLGMNRSVRAQGKTAFEFLKITRTGDKIIYHASPGGRGWTEFPLAKSEPKKVVFENLAHPFPQRIIYWLDGDDLRARIEGTVKGKARSQEWRWQKAKPGE